MVYSNAYVPTSILGERYKIVCASETDFKPTPKRKKFSSLAQ